MGYYYDDEPCEPLEDTYAIEAEWRELVGDETGTMSTTTASGNIRRMCMMRF